MLKKGKVFVHPRVWESFYLCTRWNASMWLSVFVLVSACVSVCLCSELGDRAAALTSDTYSYCLICQTLLALWLFNVLIRLQDLCLFQKITI